MNTDVNEEVRIRSSDGATMKYGVIKGVFRLWEVNVVVLRHGERSSKWNRVTQDSSY